MTSASEKRKLKILYLAKWPMNERDWRRLGINHFVETGHHVEIANLADYMHPGLEKPWGEEIHRPDTPVHHIAGFRDLLRLSRDFKNFDAAVVLLQSGFLLSSTLIPYMLLWRSGLAFAVLGPLPGPGARLESAAVPFGLRLRDFFMRLRKINPLNSVIARLPVNWFGARPAAVVLRQSEYGRVIAAFSGTRTRVLNSHTDDYEIMLRMRKENIQKKPQAVFIDQSVPHHPDYATVKSTPPAAEPYYHCLRGYFDRFEAETGLKIVVAAHPRSPLDVLQKALDGRPVFKNRTPELIAESRAVIGHFSTALGMAAALRTPIVLITTKLTYHGHFYHKHYYEMFSRELGAPLIFIDDPETAPVPPLSVNEDLYAAYEKRYMRCEGAPETPRWAAVESALQEILAA